MSILYPFLHPRTRTGPSYNFTPKISHFYSGNTISSEDNEQLERELSDDYIDIGGRSQEEVAKKIPEYIPEYRRIVDDLKGKYENKQINDIANLSFIGGGTNRKISASAPSEYFPTIVKEHGAEIFDKQCVPTNESVLTLDAYPEFLKLRRQMISDRLNQFVESVAKEA